MRPLLFLAALILPLALFSNAAQPGIWNAGGAGTFFLLYPEDSLGFQKVQMVQEQVKVQLYRGFAVVRGVYQMHNPTSDTVSIRVGYPVNSSYDATPNDRLTQVYFDDLHALRVRMRGKPVEVQKVESFERYQTHSEKDEWYVWPARFLPGDITTIEVDFIVNTNEASILEGYNRKSYNAFIYLIESGSTWKQPIGKGTILIQLMDGLTLDDIRGVSPSYEFLVNEEHNLLVWQFENLSPTAADNPVITYGEELVNNPFHTVKFKSDEYFRAIQAFNVAEALALDLQPREFGDPYDPGTSMGGITIGVFILLSVFGLPLLIVLVVLIIGIVLYRRWKRRKRSA
jgi:hypothetical protein